MCIHSKSSPNAIITNNKIFGTKWIWSKVTKRIILHAFTNDTGKLQGPSNFKMFFDCKRKFLVGICVWFEFG